MREPVIPEMLPGLIKRPEEYLQLLADESTTSTELIFLTEYASEIDGMEYTDRIVQALIKLTDHPDELVREAVLYGLNGFTGPVIYDIFFDVIENDSSPLIRAIAADLMDYRMDTSVQV